MPKVTISDTQGIVQSTGTGITIESKLSSFPSQTVNSVTATGAVTLGGVYTVSGNSVVTTTMPLASDAPGAMFIFRTLSAHAHILTGSQETAGTKVFCGFPGTSVAAQGSSLALPAVVGSSVALISDGKSFLVTAVSGSCTISGL